MRVACLHYSAWLTNQFSNMLMEYFSGSSRLSSHINRSIMLWSSFKSMLVDSILFTFIIKVCTWIVIKVILDIFASINLTVIRVKQWNSVSWTEYKILHSVQSKLNRFTHISVQDISKSNSPSQNLSRIDAMLCMLTMLTMLTFRVRGDPLICPLSYYVSLSISCSSLMW